MHKKERRQDWDDVVCGMVLMNDDGCYNRSASIHRVHDISPILPHE